MAADNIDFDCTVEAEADAIARFVELLKLEQATLGQGDIEGLSVLIQQKSEVAAELGSLAEQRNASLAAHGLGTDLTGIEAWFESHPSDTRIRSAWARILPLAREARELNRVNGELIQIRMQHNAQALEALLGASRQLNLYGPDGQTTPHSSRRINDAA